MFGHTSRTPLGLSLAAILSLATTFGAAAAPEGPSAPDALTAAAAPAAQIQDRGRGSNSMGDSGDIRSPFTYNHTGPENLAPTRNNHVVDRGVGD
jgi:hypothetical protein